ncbi:tRNA glutamyl-Q(34) synthetase GluQRS [Mucisphaera calidilacus]|uniref:tRNA glutamyl-Q(34) synthetase GluQRS n=1 Tax=Mucisphaera calidilacus TaxID=2527982 RepID=UPI001F2F2CB0|nr:tRNA glutamyl-Q(34) synthetase GluQRS [Mucisphaera calidilacus]
MSAPATPATRLAPSPTGALHLGNARTFLINWALATQNNWRIILRIEDLDGPRIKQGSDLGAIDTLRWLGITWHDGPHYQAADLTPYTHAMQTLLDQRLIYPCPATRKEIEASLSAPHADDHERRYPGFHRPTTDADWQRVQQHANDRGLLNEGDWAWRLIVPDQPITIHDTFAPPARVNVQQQVGDFVIASKAGLPAYQLAVVVDDARQSITHVVRGDDLLHASARQHWLYKFLGQEDLIPSYTHLPLVVGPDGRRLAKRHGDTRIASFRDAGVPPERIVGLIAYQAGITQQRTPMTAAQFATEFSLDTLPRTPVTCTQEDTDWLLAP